MIKIIPIPPATASASTQLYMLQVTEKLCRRLCVNAGYRLSGTISVEAGTPTVVNNVAVIPITASGTITVATKNGCFQHSRNFVETDNIALDATTDNNVTIAQGASSVTAFDDISFCHSSTATITNTFTASIA